MFQRDVRGLRWLLLSCPDLMSAKEIAQALTNLRNRYLVVASEFRGLIDDAVAETDPNLLESGSWRSSLEIEVTGEDLLETG